MIWDTVTISIVGAAVVIGPIVVWVIAREYGKIPDTIGRMRDGK